MNTEGMEPRKVAKAKHFIPQPNTGFLWKNKKKQTEKDPDCRGTAAVGGLDYWVDGRTALKEDGEKYLRLIFRRKEIEPADAETP